MKLLITLSIILNTICVSADEFVPASSLPENNQFIHKGLIRAQGTISLGSMFKPAVTNVYIYGNVEGYLDPKISIRGDSYWFLNSLGSTKPFSFNHSIFFGGSYHLKTNNHFDPYIGLQPGISITQLNGPEIFGENVISYMYPPVPKANPLLSGVVGFNYYATKFFHFFLEARYVGGKHMSGFSAPYSLNELRFSFGLGYNLN